MLQKINFLSKIIHVLWRWKFSEICGVVSDTDSDIFAVGTRGLSLDLVAFIPTITGIIIILMSLLSLVVVVVTFSTLLDYQYNNLHAYYFRFLTMIMIRILVIITQYNIFLLLLLL